MNTYKIRFDLLLSTFMLAFIFADIYPDPRLAPGLIQSGVNYIQQTILIK